MAAAFELTQRAQQGRYEVTVYQLGWRLGGKGASGRGAQHRIEEHALHVWLGFYENAFRMLREAHAELGQPDAWRDDFVEDSFIALARESWAGDARPDARTPAAAWAALFPPAPGVPGDPFVGDANPFAMAAYAKQAVRLLRALLGGLSYLESDPQRGFIDKSHLDLDLTPDPDDPHTAVRQAVDTMLSLWKTGVVSSLGGILSAVNLVERLVADFASRARQQQSADGHAPPDEEYVVQRFVGDFADMVRKHFVPLVRSDPKFALRWQIADLVLAIIVGVVRDGLITHPDGLDAINDEECRAWLTRHGASEDSVRSAFVTGLYHLGFAKERGVAAGQALRGALRMFFTYRGAFFWKMRAGMGDVVFAPLYEVLKARGVRFEFFHRLENVRMAFGASRAPFVRSLEFDVQAELMEGHDFAPLVDVKGRACWMSAPPAGAKTALDATGVDFESFLDRRKTRTRTLEVGVDFDFVVLGVGNGAVRYVCDDIDRDAGPVGRRWRDMCDNVPTVSTQSFQAWLRKDMAALGWHDESVTLTGIPGHFDTWADMRQVVPAEDWPAEDAPLTVAYFCGPLTLVSGDLPLERDAADPEHLARRRAEVRDNATDFLSSRMAQLWRGSSLPDGFDWSLLVDASAPGRLHTTRAAAAAALYVSANVNPSDQYVLASPGTLKWRISPLDTGMANLTVAGDWTACGFTEGCVEAAVMSGMLASHAISQLPRLEDIVGYDHP